MNHATLLNHAGYFNDVFTHKGFVALGSEFAEAAMAKDEMLVEFMRESIDTAINTAESYPQKRSYALRLRTPGKTFSATLESKKAPHLDHRLHLEVTPSIGQVRSRRHAVDSRLPLYTATLELKLRDNPLPIPINPRAVGGREYVIPDDKEQLVRSFLGYDVMEDTVTRIPIISSKGFYSDENPTNTCSPGLKALMTSFLQRMPSFKKYWGRWPLRRRDTATNTSSRQRSKV